MNSYPQAPAPLEPIAENLAKKPDNPFRKGIIIGLIPFAIELVAQVIFFWPWPVLHTGGSLMPLLGIPVIGLAFAVYLAIACGWMLPGVLSKTSKTKNTFGNGLLIGLSPVYILPFAEILWWWIAAGASIRNNIFLVLYIGSPLLVGAAPLIIALIAIVVKHRKARL